MKLIAYAIGSAGELEKGNRTRDWMDFTSNRFAYGCLPLIIANEAGWDIICPASFRSIWNGSPAKEGIVIQFENENEEINTNIVSHFGNGVLTFHPGFLFKTEPGHNLYVKGVPNMVKDAIQPLEGIVETDWLPLTFTMNWKFTRINTWVEFQEGDPIARIMPIPRNYLEQFNPVIKNLDSDKEINEELMLWGDDRKKFIELKETNQALRTKMEGNYFKGVDKRQKKIDTHQKKLDIRDFTKE